MGATLSGSPKFVLPPSAQAKNFNMTGAISMQCLQHHRHFGNTCRCNDFGKAGNQRRPSAHSDLQHSHQRDRSDVWDPNNNGGAGKVVSSKTLSYIPSISDSTSSTMLSSASSSTQQRYHYQQHHHQHQGSTHERSSQSTHGYYAEPIKPSKSMASLKDSARSSGQLSDGVVGLPVLKPKLSASPNGAVRPMRPHSQVINGSHSMSQLRATQPAALNGLNSTLTLASKRVSSIFAKRSSKDPSSRHARSVTADAAGASSNASASSIGPRAVTSDARGDSVTDKEKENSSVFENAPSHNYRQTIPKSMSCYNIKSQQSLESAQSSDHSAVQHDKSAHRKTVLQASTTELLHYLSEYLYRQSPQLHSSFKPTDAIMWIRSADKNLILQGWSDINFINPANVVFVFMLLRNVVDYREIRTVNELHAITMTCLYVAYSYMGNEISYPLKPFFLGCDDRDLFWQRCVDIINLKSEAMLRLNTDPAFFAETFAELKGYSIKLAESSQ